MSGIYAKLFNIDKKQHKKQELYNLHLRPQREKGDNMPHFQPQLPNMLHQADLLFLPNDDGFKYALVVIDVGTRHLEAVPLKTKESSEINKAFDKLYKTKHNIKIKNKLTVPYKLQVDAGNEFKGSVKSHLEKKGIIIDVAPVGRHRRQAIVERANQTIGYVLHQRMNSQEILTGETSREWINFLPKVIKAMNEHAKKRKTKPLPNQPLGSGNTLDLIPMGTKVRVKLDAPIDVAFEQKLYGRFRKSDIRFNPKIRIVKEILIKPNSPPLYLLDGDVGKRKVEPIAYTKQQLQIVPKNEIAPDGDKVIHGKPKTYIVLELLDKKKIKGAVHYLTKWKGFKTPTWEPRANLIKTVPKLVHDYDKTH